MTVLMPVVSSDEEALILVDEEDREIGSQSKLACHEGDGVLHRAFSVFLFTRDSEVLLQRRSTEKRLWPGFWSNACCSHPRVGEVMSEAVHRRMQQELGVAAEVQYVYKFIYQASYFKVGSEHELCSVWVGDIDMASLQPNTNEISEVRLLSADALTDALATRPDEFTPWLRMEWSRLTQEFPEHLPRG